MTVLRMPVLLVLLLLLSCGTDSENKAEVTGVVEEVAVCSDVTQEEVQAVTAVAQAFRSLAAEDSAWAHLKSTPDECLFFVRSSDQQIPRVCRSAGGCQSIECADQWGELPNVLGVPPTDPSVGYGGFAGDEVIFINRMGSKEDDLVGLLRHELAHALADLDHGAELKALEQAVQPYIMEITASAQ